MATITPSVAPGAYPSAQTVGWTFDPTVTEVAYTVNGLPPAISEYIAYDTLVPPNPFIAVTQDGAGNVVYDGGFPKFYNLYAPALGSTFAELTGSFKYLYNALNFIANPTKVAAGNKKILVIGDQIAAGNYSVKGTDPNSFFTSLTNICSIAGFIPTFKDVADWGTQINIALTELNQYCGVIFMSSAYDLNNAPFITSSSITDFVTYRSQGNGIIFITDHGTNVQTDINLVTGPAGAGFYGSANRIMVNFGAFFTGVYDRTPVNVGFIRSTYGDHPLYNGMDDSESIVAGGSESKVIVISATMLAPGAVPNMTMESGANRVRFLVKLANGSIETYTFVYNVASGEIILFKDIDGADITGIDVGWDYRAKAGVSLVGAGLGTLSGSIYVNTTKVGETHFDETGGSKELWYGGEPVRVNNGDTLRATIDSPFTYTRTIPITRIQPSIFNTNGLGKIVHDVNNAIPGSRVTTVGRAVVEVGRYYPAVYAPGGAKNVQLLRNYFNNTFPLSDVNANAFDTPAALSAALLSLVPPTPQQIFNNWSRFNVDAWYPKGVTPEGDAAAWYWDDALGQAVQPNNTPGYTGFVSDYSVLDYDLEVTLKSTNGDDDFISVVLAHVRDTDTNQNHTLDLVLTRGAKGYETRTIWPNQLLCTDFQYKNTWATQTGRYKELSAVAGEDTGGWSGAFKRVKVLRRGDQFTIQATAWSGTVYDSAYNMSVNLNDIPELTKFKGAHPIGFATMSQPAATFGNIAFADGYRRDIILDMLNNRVYRYLNSEWQLAAGVTVHSIFGAPRIIKALEGGKSYRLNTNGTITVV